VRQWVGAYRRRRVTAVVATTAVLITVVVGTLAVPAGAGSDGNTNRLQLRAAIAATKAAYKGTSRAVDPTPRPAVRGKYLIVVSAGQSSISAQVPAAALVDAAEAIGWRVDVYDGMLTPARYPQLVRQAIAAGADALLTLGIDCQAVKRPLEEARAEGIAVTGLAAFDCSDPRGGAAKQSLFNAPLNFGPEVRNVGDWVASYGVDQANYVIAKSKNAAKIMLVTGPEYTTLYYVDRGFRRTIAKSGSSKIVSTLEISNGDFLNGQLLPKIQAELLRHPDVNWIRSPFTYATTLGVVPALGANDSNIKVMGGEGYQPELDLIRAGKITAVNVVSAGWEAWAAVDSLNSVFRGEKPVDSGFGWTMTDQQHNLPPSGEAEPAFDYRAAYRKAWGVG
jgi:ribose transport system substrate-binding protein